VNKNKVSGAPSAPFFLPQRWTYHTLRKCIHDNLSRLKSNGDKEKVTIKKLFFKKSGKSKALVALENDGDIPALLREYPLTWSGSGKKRECKLPIAVEWAYKHDKHGTVSDSIMLIIDSSFGL